MTITMTEEEKVKFNDILAILSKATGEDWTQKVKDKEHVYLDESSLLAQATLVTMKLGHVAVGEIFGQECNDESLLVWIGKCSRCEATLSYDASTKNVLGAPENYTDPDQYVNGFCKPA